MQKVISNSSAVIHLAKINKLDILREYFQTITIPERVYKECIVEGKGRPEIETIKKSDWINVKHVKDKNLVKLLSTTLDDGEAEAIALAIETGADLILLDDSDAREKARLYRLNITGIIGVLLRAKIDSKIDSLKATLTELRSSGFRIDEDLERCLLKEAGEL